MGEHFRGWKRKTGVVTLAVACLLSIEWLRTQSLQQEITFTLHNRNHKILTFHGGFIWLSDGPEWMSRNPTPNPWTFHFLSLIVPLIVISAWLLLSKPRRARKPVA